MSERHAFGRPINRFQVLRHRMAQLHAEAEALKAYVYHCARLQDEGLYAVKECSIAKLLTTEFANKAAYECLQMFGGYGYIEDYKVARMYRDSRILTIGGGTSEIMREIIAKMFIDDKAYTAPRQAGGSGANSTPSPSSSTVADEVTQLLSARLAGKPPLGTTLKFDFGQQKLYIDSQNHLSPETRMQLAPSPSAPPT